MMQIHCLPSCQNFEPSNVARKQNSRGLRKTYSTGRETRPRGADSIEKIYRQGCQGGEEKKE